MSAPDGQGCRTVGRGCHAEAGDIRSNVAVTREMRGIQGETAEACKDRWEGSFDLERKSINKTMEMISCAACRISQLPIS